MFVSIDVTYRKMRRIIRWLKNKQFPLKIVYEYNNSIGDCERREYYGTIVDFKFVKYDDNLGWMLNLTFDNGAILEEHFNVSWEFCRIEDNNCCYDYRAVAMRYCNSGPYCYFMIKRTDI